MDVKYVKVSLGSLSLGRADIYSEVNYSTERELPYRNLLGDKRPNHRRPERKLRRAKR